ncbi:MAG: single-stranded DNA-binding protein [Treponema sp.]|nr:single-stranded DNA-binding protein [Treponema sp.]
MNQLNSLIIEGNVTHQPELKETPNGYKVCVVPVAVNRFYKNSKGEGVNEVSYFNVESFGKMAESCAKNCEKGRGVRVVGRLKQSRWQTEEGKQTSRVSIIAEHMEFKKRLVQEDSSEAGGKEDLRAIKAANQASVEQELQLEREEYAEAAVF